MKDKGNDKKRENKTANKIVPMYDIRKDITEIANPDGSVDFKFGKGIPDYYDFGVFYQLQYGYDEYLKLVDKANKEGTSLRMAADDEARREYSRYTN